MKKEIAEKWVAALRSGEYEQGTGCMVQGFDSPKFCCLGVLADIYRKEVSKKPFSIIAIKNLSTEGLNELPSSKIAKWAGFNVKEDESVDPMIKTKNNGDVCLSELNDETLKSFKWIAKKIEKQWESL
jgi:hypothetical protein